MQCPAKAPALRSPQALQLPLLQSAVHASQCRLSAPHIEHHRARQAEGHGGCTLRHAHLERRLPCAQAVAEVQQMAPDAFGTTAQLQQPGREQQQVWPVMSLGNNHKADLSSMSADFVLAVQINVVMKFGGSSVANADRMWEVAQIICSFPHLFPCIVLSAMGKVSICVMLYTIGASLWLLFWLSALASADTVNAVADHKPAVASWSRGPGSSPRQCCNLVTPPVSLLHHCSLYLTLHVLSIAASQPLLDNMPLKQHWPQASASTQIGNWPACLPAANWMFVGLQQSPYTFETMKGVTAEISRSYIGRRHKTCVSMKKQRQRWRSC